MTGNTRNPTNLGTFFDVVRRTVEDARSPAGQAAAWFAHAIVPKCHLCGKLSIVPAPCLLCGRPACETHGFFHASGGALCVKCLGESGIELDLDGSGFSEQDDSAAFPWVDLGIKPTGDLNEIRKAYHRKASKTHPDHFTDELEKQAAEQQFKRLTHAYEEAMSMAKER